MDGTMPWRLSEDYEELGRMDMDYFREITKGAKVVLGMGTWLSMGEKPLLGRKEHYVITSQKDVAHDDPRVKFMDLKTFIKKYADDDEIICIGGGQIYKQLFPYFKEIYWNELKLKDNFFKEVLPKYEDRVYLNRKMVHALKNPNENGFREGATVMNLDSQGNTITYKRFIKKFY